MAGIWLSYSCSNVHKAVYGIAVTVLVAREAFTGRTYGIFFANKLTRDSTVSYNLVPRPSTPRFYLTAVEKNRFSPRL